MVFPLLDDQLIAMGESNSVFVVWSQINVPLSHIALMALLYLDTSIFKIF